MTGSDSCVRLTVAQAIVRWLMNQFIEIDGIETRICSGGFGIFGHGNVPCLGEALYPVRQEMPLYRGQNEQSMGFAAAAYAKYHLRRRFMFCTASAGPGTANLLTAAALAHANRLPMLMLCGDTFLTRLPDPVLQQLEHFGNPALGLNDAFRAVSRYWDRITHPAQILQSLPAALATMLDPADCGPAFLGLPQDVQGWAWDYPTAFFDRRVHRIRRQSPDVAEIAEAAALLRAARRPVIVAGGGVQYSGAVAELTAFAESHGIPVVETIAGRANLLATHSLNIGPLGVTGSDSANTVAGEADVVLAVGTRLQDFTTGSWTVFAGDARLIGLNAGRHDAAKHQSLTVVGDAKLGLLALDAAIAGYRAPEGWTTRAQAERRSWDAYVAQNVAPGNRPNSYAQAIGVVNATCDPRDRIVTAAGGLPAEVTANWRTLGIGTVDVEFGFSCMGYEIAGGWGARIAQAETEPDRDTIVFVGDGSYLLMNSDIYSSVLTGKKLIVLVLDNGGFAVINKLQNNTGQESFNNLISDCPTVPDPFTVDFEAHARAMGANAETVANPEELAAAFRRAKAAPKTSVIVMQVDPHMGWTTQGHAWWEIGTAESLRHPRGPRQACRGRGRARRSEAGGLMADLARLAGRNILVIGRAGMDLYADPPGTRTEDATRFTAALGGSSANIAVALARQGCKAALVTCVSDDAVGRFCLNQLHHYGVDHAHVRIVGGEARNSLAVVETRIEDCQSVIYRNGAADFEMTAADVEAVDHAAFSALVTTGTVLATEPSRSAAFRAFDLARAAGLPLIFDIDYRPYSWASPQIAAEVYSSAGALCDVIVGNDVEFGFMAGHPDRGLGMARSLIARGAQIVVYKMGEKGSITLTPEDEFATGIYRTNALKPTGAGDSFLGAFIAALADGLPVKDAVRRGSAAAAMVVARVGCAPAMPDRAELDAFLAEHGGPTPA